MRMRIARAAALLAASVLVALPALSELGGASPALGISNRALSARGGHGDPLAALALYRQADTDVNVAQAQLLAAGRTADARLLGLISRRPRAVWLGPWDGPDPGPQAAALIADARRQRSLPVLVTYDIPGRDCGHYSAAAAQAYRQWIAGLAGALGSWPVAVIVEPDALAGLGCASPSDQATTIGLLRRAVLSLTARRRTTVYVDAGNSNWMPVAVMATRLRAVGVSRARGFALNVSNFNWTASELSYGRKLSAATHGAHFVIDTGRNGRGPAPGNEVCNPPGRGLGVPPSTRTATPLADAYLWVKIPGESDGACHGGPSAGVFWTAYALGLAERAHP